MRLELPIRWTEKESIEDLFDESEEPKEKTYSYGRLSIDSEDIGPYYDIDEDNTMINDKNGKMYCITVPFDEFKKIFTEVTGKAIMAVKTKTDYKPPKKSNDLSDDILGD